MTNNDTPFKAKSFNFIGLFQLKPSDIEVIYFNEIHKSREKQKSSKILKMNFPNSFKQFWIALVFSFSTKNCNAEEPWTGDCRELTKGYNLTDDYDATLPPSIQTKVSLITHIFDISEVDDFSRLV